MAQLKDLIVNGASRLIGSTYANNIQITTLNAPISAGSTTYGAGTNGYVLKTNGSSIYWGADTDTNTWRPIQNVLTSTATDQSLSANMGKTLNDTKVAKAGDTMTGNLTMSANTYVQKAGQSVSWYQGRKAALIKTTSYTGYNSIYSLKTTAGDWSCGVYTDNKLYWSYVTDANYNAGTNTCVQMRLEPNGYLYTVRTYGAVWNDYAEFRETKEKIEPGRCIKEVGNDTLILSTERLQAGCEIVSDTYGFAIGETEKNKTPTAVSGRVLAYPYEDKELLRNHIGEPVCSGPNGTVSLMTHEEEKEWPSRIIGTISAIPDYEIWNSGDKEQSSVKVNGRIWIKVK